MDFMDVRILRYFLTLAREGTISAAAEKLHTTQPNLSRQLNDLEVELGKKLFLRGSRKITLTEEGVFLRSRAQEIVDLLDKTESEFGCLDEISGGEISIGAGETEAMRTVAFTMSRLHQAYPNITFHLFSGNADDVTERLDKGLLDFGILIEPADMGKYEYLSLPTKDIWGLLLRKDHPLAQKSAITPEDFADLPLLCSRQSLLENKLSGWLGEASDRIRIVATYNLIYNASLLVEAGIGCALCLDKLIPDCEDTPLSFRPLAPRLEAGLNIVWKKRSPFSKACALFLRELQQVLSQPDAGTGQGHKRKEG